MDFSDYITNIVDEFIQYRVTNGNCNLRTAKTIRFDLVGTESIQFISRQAGFFPWLCRDNPNVISLEDIKLIHIYSYINYVRKNRDSCDATIFKNTINLRLFFMWVYKIKHASQNIAFFIDIPKKVNASKDVPLTVTDIVKIREYLELTFTNNPMSFRQINRCAIFVCLLAGLRVGEITKLRPDCLIKTAGGLFIVVNGRCGARSVPLSESDWLLLESYINISKSQDHCKNYLFDGIAGKQMSVRAIEALVERVLSEIDIKACPKDFRNFIVNKAIYDQDIGLLPSIADKFGNVMSTCMYRYTKLANLKNIQLAHNIG